MTSHKRHGTTTLFAAMNVLDGTVIGHNMQRHRHQEFIRFLNAVEREIPAGKTVHAILDNYAAHKHPAPSRQWLAHHPQWTFNFAPTSPLPGLNAVEGFFAGPNGRRLQREVFRSRRRSPSGDQCGSSKTTTPSPSPSSGSPIPASKSSPPSSAGTKC